MAHMSVAPPLGLRVEKKMTKNVLQVLTLKGTQSILDLGGTQSWKLNRARAMKCEYAVLCRNANAADTEGKEAHGSAFMVGRISDVVPATDELNRWLVLFTEYAVVNVAEQWEGRNPVHFYTTDQYEGDIDFDTLDWRPMPSRSSSVSAVPIALAGSPTKKGMTMAEAKAGLANTFGVDPSDIEITIRG
jgi:hypothetical protein